MSIAFQAVGRNEVVGSCFVSVVIGCSIISEIFLSECFCCLKCTIVNVIPLDMRRAHPTKAFPMVIFSGFFRSAHPVKVTIGLGRSNLLYGKVVV